MRAVAMKSDPSGISNQVELLVTSKDSDELSYLKINLYGNIEIFSAIGSVTRIILRPNSLKLNMRQATFLNFGSIFQENIGGEPVFGAMFVGVADRVPLKNGFDLDYGQFGVLDYTISTQSCSQFSANTASI